jgi:hypothetical protein
MGAVLQEDQWESLEVYLQDPLIEIKDIVPKAWAAAEKAATRKAV